MYPLILELVLNTSPNRTDEQRQRLATNHMLMEYIHANATTVIIHWAEREGIDSKSIFRSAQLCLKKTRENPFWCGDPAPGKRFDSWPHCLGPSLNGLSERDREIVLDADASIAQLNARVDLPDCCDGQGARTNGQPRGHERRKITIHSAKQRGSKTRQKVEDARERRADTKRYCASSLRTKSPRESPHFCTVRRFNERNR